MSAIEQFPLPADRRRGERTRLDRVLRALVGRNDGVFVDISLRGAKIRHAGALQRGAKVRIAFDWERQHFSATAEVLASRVVALGTREGESATFESRFHFVTMAAESREILSRVILAVANDELRTWVGNLKGFGDTPNQKAEPAKPAGYIRCRQIGRTWEKKWTREATQPPDGFLLPAGTDPSQVEALCSAWETMDADARQLVQLTASAVVEESQGLR